MLRRAHVTVSYQRGTPRWRFLTSEVSLRRRSSAPSLTKTASHLVLPSGAASYQSNLVLRRANAQATAIARAQAPPKDAKVYLTVCID